MPQPWWRPSYTWSRGKSRSVLRISRCRGNPRLAGLRTVNSGAAFPVKGLHADASNPELNVLTPASLSASLISP
jgi:hypothetical protein